ncbi:ribbon-helix-helix domain-containing protein [Nitratireductor pacificus]|uniref:Ribbon-helix-helix domain-containing protein n=1 Tax=Nitratireductor pacificus pht-3B TaxID=391937 RepID=K2MFB9_9HYPH|nr:ribbon-helix-helix domain-containing protein [Nitratireductor pacificus]EKF20831.1 hypothetical protein NA2_00595 [Nitratireductor pacificus pht-3B]
MTPVHKHSVSIRGHRTSVSLEPPFFQELERIAGARGQTVAAVIAMIDNARDDDTNLSSALRLFVLEQVKKRAGD